MFPITDLFFVTVIILVIVGGFAFIVYCLTRSRDEKFPDIDVKVRSPKENSGRKKVRKQNRVEKPRERHYKGERQ